MTKLSSFGRANSVVYLETALHLRVDIDSTHVTFFLNPPPRPRMMEYSRTGMRIE